MPRLWLFRSSTASPGHPEASMITRDGNEDVSDEENRRGSGEGETFDMPGGGKMNRPFLPFIVLVG